VAEAGNATELPTSIVDLLLRIDEQQSPPSEVLTGQPAGEEPPADDGAGD
jgi:hypothetical protein